MSHEEPGDGIRCDHCNRHKSQSQDGHLYPNRGEKLCDGCLWRAVQADRDAPVGPMNVPARQYITPRAH